MVQAQKVMEKSKSAVKPARTIVKVGIVGAGQMGAGIAHVVALGGYKVALNDLKRETFDNAVSIIDKNMLRQVTKGTIKDGDREKALNRITYAPALEAFGDCDLVIEAATEDEETKHRIFAALGPHLKPTALLASNTSSISITRLAAATDRPEDFHRYALHEPGSSDGIGGAHSRDRDRRRNVCHRQSLCRKFG